MDVLRELQKMEVFPEKKLRELCSNFPNKLVLVPFVGKILRIKLVASIANMMGEVAIAPLCCCWYRIQDHLQLLIARRRSLLLLLLLPDPRGVPVPCAVVGNGSNVISCF